MLPASQLHYCRRHMDTDAGHARRLEGELSLYTQEMGADVPFTGSVSATRAPSRAPVARCLHDHICKIACVCVPPPVSQHTWLSTQCFDDVRACVCACVVLWQACACTHCTRRASASTCAGASTRRRRTTHHRHGSASVTAPTVTARPPTTGECVGFVRHCVGHAQHTGGGSARSVLCVWRAPFH